MNRPHIAVFGLRNSGKSALINALAGQDVAIVSDVAGTTTDPVKKIMELSGVGAVVLIDTAGIDDEGELGGQRVLRTKALIKQVDLALLLFASPTMGPYELNLLSDFTDAGLPYILVHSKSDLTPVDPAMEQETCACSAKNGAGIEALLGLIQNKLSQRGVSKPSLLGDLIVKGNTVVLVCPVDSGAPEGRLILPQVQTIRDVLDHQALALVLTPSSFEAYMQKRGEADLIITDSQLFGWVEQWAPAHTPLTSFSVLLAHHKGLFSHYVRGTPLLSRLQEGDRILILESCTHHASCEDIGRVKLPAQIRSFTAKKLSFTMVAGLDPLPDRLSTFALAIQCGGCMVTPRQLNARVAALIDQGIPVTNYGMALSYMAGIFDRAVAPFLNDERR
ncbi:MAG: [FeFe] hydrogenase H-cluster maturation GTPase HydF [Bacteroidetes bacterium]|nr:[FeFe] hydrogenase H-cluster maturation GTPase HydF [Bacteroidota bacterium]